MNLEFKLFKHQRQFCADTESFFLALIGGFGCGKTKAFCHKTIIMAALNVGYEGAIAEPTERLTRTLLVPELKKLLEEHNIPYVHSKQDSTITIQFAEGSTKIHCLSGENYTRLVGYNLAFFGTDETDTSNTEIAEEMWNMAISRVRTGRHLQIYSTSTPEGFKFLQKFFVARLAEQNALQTKIGVAPGTEEAYIREHFGTVAGLKSRAIHATSYENPLLEWQNIEAMRSIFSPAQFKVRTLGQFGNLNSSIVYDCFDRDKNASDLELRQVPVHIAACVGMDFNVDHCAAVVHILTKDGPVAVKEFVNIKDVPTMIKTLRADPDLKNRHIIVYPDASGKNRNAGGFATNIDMLRDAGFDLRYNPANPPVGDRINSMNAMFLNSNGERRYKVNTKNCPVYTKCLEQQSRLKDGSPDKSNNVDHPLDAAGYFIAWEFPITRKHSITVRN